MRTDSAMDSGTEIGVAMRKVLTGILLTVIVIGFGLWYRKQTANNLVAGTLSAAAAASGTDDPRWQRVLAPRPFIFPQDHGPHDTYQTEWWYYTGNLQAQDGQRFGYQLTFFRRGLDPAPAVRTSAWATRNIYLAHFTVSHISTKRFYATEHFSRDGLKLAGAAGEPYRVWLDQWQASGSGPQGLTMHLQANGDGVAIDLNLNSTKPPVLQGDQGYSVKGQGEGNASYYYSLTRMATTGRVTINSQEYSIIAGESWMDHEWGTSRLDAQSIGWDWFALQLDDQREITWAQLRHRDGKSNKDSFGSITAPDGSVSRLGPDDVILDVLSHWRSPRSGAQYPAAWRLRIPKAGIDLEIKPRIADQELPVSIVYWEGAVAANGQATTAGTSKPLTAQGYVELTGYTPGSGDGLGR